MMNSNIDMKGMKLAVTITPKLSATTPVVLGGNPEESIKKAALLGYKAVEVHWGTPEEIQKDLELIKLTCQKNNIYISAFGTGRSYVEEGLSLIDDDENKRKLAVKRLKDYIDIASSFKSIVIIGLMRGNIPSQDKIDYYLKRLARSTIEVAEYGESKGVQIVFEAINRYENNYLNRSSEIYEFIEKNNIPNTKILLDTFHMNIEESCIKQSIIECGDKIGYVHFADSNRKYVGAGHIDFNEIISTLKSIDYKGYISAECLPIPDPDIAARKWIEGVRENF